MRDCNYSLKQKETGPQNVTEANRAKQFSELNLQP